MQRGKTFQHGRAAQRAIMAETKKNTEKQQKFPTVITTAATTETFAANAYVHVCRFLIFYCTTRNTLRADSMHTVRSIHAWRQYQQKQHGTL
jgi:hypothetical protein